MNRTEAEKIWDVHSLRKLPRAERKRTATGTWAVLLDGHEIYRSSAWNTAQCYADLINTLIHNFFAPQRRADIIERAGGKDATAQGPWTIRKDADFSGSADYPWMVVSNAPHGPCDANVFCSRMSEEDARMVVKALTSACGETAWVSVEEFHK